MSHYDDNPAALEAAVARQAVRDALFPVGSWGAWVLMGDPTQPWEVNARRELRRVIEHVHSLLPSTSPVYKVTK